jgi:hypothetical protein
MVTPVSQRTSRARGRESLAVTSAGSHASAPISALLVRVDVYISEYAFLISDALDLNFGHYSRAATLGPPERPLPPRGTDRPRRVGHPNQSLLVDPPGRSPRSITPVDHLDHPGRSSWSIPDRTHTGLYRFVTGIGGNNPQLFALGGRPLGVI